MAAGAAGEAPVVREAAERDLAAIHEIYAYHVRHGLGSFEQAAPGVAELRARREAVRAAGLPYLVAGLGDSVAGFAYAVPYRHRSAYRHTVEDSVYIAPEIQRRGLGGALLARLIALCAARDLREMVAVIGDSGNLPSIRLHERHGFRHAGRLEGVGFKHGRWLDTVIMQRALKPGQRQPPGDLSGFRARHNWAARRPGDPPLLGGDEKKAAARRATARVWGGNAHLRAGGSD